MLALCEISERARRGAALSALVAALSALVAARREISERARRGSARKY
jgi:hypothetical protein